MHPPFRRSFYILLCGLAIACAEAEFSDPVGYMSFDFVAGKKGALAVPLAKGYRMGGPVSAAGADYIEFATDLPPDQLGVAQSACLDVRSGPGAGQSLRVTGISGRRVNFEGPALMPIAVGTTVAVRPNWSLGELIGSPPFPGVQEGETAAAADVLGLQDPVTQSSRDFFYKSGEGWREVGNESAGDRSTTAIPYRSSLQFFRRGETDIQIVLVGTVPMYSAATHHVRVWPGRNLLTTPFSPARRVDHLFNTSSLVSGRSAPRSDSFRLIYPDASRSRILYFNELRGWTSIGGGAEDAGATPLNLIEAMDFQHVGEGSFLEFNTAQAIQPIAPAGSVPEQVVPIDPALSDLPAREIGWSSQPGTRYQVQIQSGGSSLWVDHGSPVVASGTVCRKACRPEGKGIFRIVIR